MANQATKTASEIKDETINWGISDGTNGPVLQPGELIATSAWVASNINGDTALNVAADPNTISSDRLSTTVWLGGGTPGQVYSVTNTIVTNNSPPRTYARSFQCYVNAINSL